MSSPTSAPGTNYVSRQALQLLAAVVLRVLALTLAADVSGSLHGAMDIAVVAGVFAHPDDDCEQDGHECPPGCLSCHCAHAAAWSRPAVSEIERELPPPVASTPAAEYTASAPAIPEHARLDRPPRA